MTKFTDKKFSVAVGSEEYRANFDKVFGKGEQPAREPPKPGSLWKHTKTGREYAVLSVATFEPTLEKVVVYFCNADEALDYPEWVRPLDNFMGLNDEGQPRFTEVLK